MPTIKLIDVRMMALRAAIKKEEQRLQDVADQVARISAGLDMELKSSSGIEEILSKLRNNLKKQSGNWTVMHQLAQQASADLHQKDEELAQKARGLNYSARQFVQSGLASTIGGKLVPNVAVPLLGLSALNKLDLTQGLGELFDGVGSGFGDALQGVSLGELSTQGNHSAETGEVLGATAERDSGNILDNVIDSLKGVGAGVGTAYMVGTHVLQALFDTPTKEQRSSAVRTGVAAISSALASGDQTKLNDAVDAWIETQKREALAISKEKAEQLTAETGREHAVDSWGNVYDVQERQEWQAEENAKEEAWKAEQERLANRNILEKAWDGMKAVANSKPVEYSGEIVGDVIETGGSLVSYVDRLLKLDYVGAASAGYNFINGFFETAQDADALLTYRFGGVFDALGMQDMADEYYAEAEVKAGREGLADELHATSWGDGFGYAIDIIDIGVASYELASGAQELDSAIDGMSWTTGEEIIDNLLTLSGWKDAGKLGKTAGMAERIDHYSDIISNVGTGHKYVEGLSEGLLGEDGLFMTMLGNTSPGKIGWGVPGIGQKILDLIEAAASENDD